MHFSRRLPRIAAHGRVAVRLSTAQRDLVLHSVGTPRSLWHLLHRAPVHQGKLEVRVTREALDSLILVMARIQTANREVERELDAFLRYLENLADRFEVPPDDEQERRAEVS